MPNRIKVERHGMDVAVHIDGFVVWADDVTVSIDDRKPSVTLTLTAGQVDVHNCVPAWGYHDGEAERQEAQEPAEECVRVPG